MLIHFVTDEPAKIPAIRTILEPRYRVVSQLLGADETLTGENGALLVDADLRKATHIERIRRVIQQQNRIPEKLFVVERHSHHLIAQAYALGATAVVSRPREIQFKLAQIDIAESGPRPASSLPRLRLPPAQRPSRPCSRQYVTADR